MLQKWLNIDAVQLSRSAVFKPISKHPCSLLHCITLCSTAQSAAAKPHAACTQTQVPDSPLRVLPASPVASMTSTTSMSMRVAIMLAIALGLVLCAVRRALPESQRRRRFRRGGSRVHRRAFKLIKHQCSALHR